MFSIFSMKCIQNQVLVSVVLSILVIFLIWIYFSNYIRMCYYASKLPGPSAYPIIGNASMFMGTNEETTHNLITMGTKYQIFRLWLGPLPIFVTSDAKSAQEILTNENSLEKPYIHKYLWNFVMGKSILTSEVPEWKHHRSIIIRGFSPIILKSYFNIFVEKIDILTQKLDLELNNEKSFDIFEFLSRTTLDAVCGSTMGANINSHEHESLYLDTMRRALHLLTARSFNILKIPSLFYRFTQDYKMVSKCRNILGKFTDNIISEKRKKYDASVNNNGIDVKAINKNEYKKPLLEFLMDFKTNNSDLTDTQLRDEVNLIIFAAYETSSNALSFLLLQLAFYKDIQTKVYNEIFEVCGDINRNGINFDDLSKLKYMDMVIKESMRLISTVPIIGRETSQDIKLGNYTFPKGATILIPIFTLHRNKYYWENPLKFDPERFTPENIKNQHPYAHIPFSAGPRCCIGMRYSWILMKTILATLLSRYEFHTDLNMDELRFEAAVTMQVINGHQVRITPRQKL